MQFGCTTVTQFQKRSALPTNRHRFPIQILGLPVKMFQLRSLRTRAERLQLVKIIQSSTAVSFWTNKLEIFESIFPLRFRAAGKTTRRKFPDLLLYRRFSYCGNLVLELSSPRWHLEIFLNAVKVGCKREKSCEMISLTALEVLQFNFQL